MSQSEGANASGESNEHDKTAVEIWGKAPGSFKESIVINFLGDVCNIGIHYIEQCNFRVSITTLELENKGLN